MVSLQNNHMFALCAFGRHLCAKESVRECEREVGS